MKQFIQELFVCLLEILAFKGNFNDFILTYWFIITAIIMTENQQHRRIIKSASVRTRFTPTFYHHDIFGESDLTKSQVRVTPTFESTVFNCDGYNVQTHHSRTLKTKEQSKNIPETHVYVNQSRQRKQAFLNPCTEYCPQYRNSHLNDEKEKLAEDINHLAGRTSRLRKCVELMSNPIFGGFAWTPVLPNTLIQKSAEAYDPNQYRYDRKENLKRQSPQKEKQKIEQQPKIEIKEQKQQNKAITAKQTIKNTSKQPNKSTSKHSNNLKKFKSAANLRLASAK